MSSSPFGPRDRATESVQNAKLLGFNQKWHELQDRLIFDQIRNCRLKGLPPRTNVLDKGLFDLHYGDQSYRLYRYLPNMDFALALLALITYYGYSHALLTAFVVGWIGYVKAYRAILKSSPAGFINSFNWALQLSLCSTILLVYLLVQTSREEGIVSVTTILTGTCLSAVLLTLNHFHYFKTDTSEPFDDPPPDEEYRYKSSLVTNWSHLSHPGLCRIRLIRLHRRVPFKRLRATIKEVRIEDAPSYTAISYTWGKNPDKNKTLVVDGCAFHCTAATYNALYRASSWWSSELVWLDYVCIDQSNTGEKSDQVELMRHIYAGAKDVRVQMTPIVPPGGGTPNTNGVGKFIRRLAWLVSEFEPSHEEIHDIFKREIYTYGRSRLTDMIEFFANPWFSRVWIIQEVVVGSPVSVYYDDRYINWESLSFASGIFADKEFAVVIGQHELGPLARRNALRLSSILRVRESHRKWILSAPYMHHDPDMAAMFRTSVPANIMPLEYVLSSCISFDASDVRDKVFAMVGLIIETYDVIDTSLLRPDYRKTVEQVMRAAAEYLCHRRTIMETLSLAGVGLHHEPSKYKLPSWVPDWTRPAVCHPLHMPRSPDLEKSKYNASKGTLPYIAWAEDDSKTKIVLLGSVFDKIAAIGPVNAKSDADSGDPKRSADETMRLLDWHDRSLQLMLNEATGSDVPWEREFVNHIFWRVIIGDRSPAERPPPPQMEERYKYWLEAARRLRSANDTMDTQTQVIAEKQTRDMTSIPWNEAMDWCARGRRVFVSDRGHVGMAPPGAKVGDEIVIIQGAATPFVVRHPPGSICPESGACRLPFHLVGECYMHGMMDGEIVRDYNASTGVGLVFI